MGNFLLPGGVIIRTWGSFAWGHEEKWIDSIFWVINAFSSNLNTINLKIFPKHGETYRLDKNLANILEIDKESIVIWEGVSLRLILKD